MAKGMHMSNLVIAKCKGEGWRSGKSVLDMCTSFLRTWARHGPHQAEVGCHVTTAKLMVIAKRNQLLQSAGEKDSLAGAYCWLLGSLEAKKFEDLSSNDTAVVQEHTSALPLMQCCA